MKKLTATLRLTPAGHDSDDVHFKRGEDGVGFGYRPKSDKTKICLIKCPNCGRENYAMQVSSGFCAFCGQDGREYLKLIE